MSLGRDVVALPRPRHQRTIGLCRRSGETGGGQGWIWCARGAAETLVNLTADAQDGIRFCRALPGADAKADCYGAVGGFTRALHTDAEVRARHCATSEPAFVAACRRGAALDPREPSTGST